MVICLVCIWSSSFHCYPIVSCFIKIQNDLTFLVLAYPGRPGKEAVKQVPAYCVHVCLLKIQSSFYHLKIYLDALRAEQRQQLVNE